jgi:hypothetical protein
MARSLARKPAFEKYDFKRADIMRTPSVKRVTVGSGTTKPNAIGEQMQPGPSGGSA